MVLQGEAILGTITTTAPIADARDVIENGVPAMRLCYVRSLRLNPTLAGAVVITLHVAADGAVAGGDVAPDTLGPEFGACVPRALRWLRFQPPGRPCDVAANVTFQRTADP